MAEGWHAGFLSSTNLHSFVSADSIAGWRPCVPTLIVLDYAASKVADPRRLFEHLSALEAEAERDDEAREATPPVRVLLLERHADEARGWLHELLAGGEGVTGDLLRSVCFLGLRKLQPPGGKTAKGTAPAEFTRQIIENTFERWAAISGRQPPKLPEFAEPEWRSVQLRTGNRPLYLQMAAIHACERNSAVQLPGWGRGELLRSAVARERMYVKKECGGDIDLCTAVEHVTAILCLTGGGAARGRQWIPTVGEELGKIGVSIAPNQVEHRRRAIFTEVQTGLNEAETGVIQPDIVSEGFAAQVLQGEEGGPTETLKLVLRLSGIRGWANLVRMVQDLTGIEKQLFTGGEAGSIESWLPPLLAERPREELRELTHIIPERSISLHGFAVIVNEHLLESVPAERIAERAECLLALGTHRCRMARMTREMLEKAVEELQEAIQLFGQLPLDAAEGGCRLKMAKAYRLLDNTLSNLSRYEEAVRHSTTGARLASGETAECRAAQETGVKVEVGSFGAPQGQEAMLEFANCLNNLGLNLNPLGRNAEALEVMKRAVEVGEQLIGHNWHQYAPDLARYLNNLSQAQTACNDRAGAIVSSRRSAQIRTEFARENPDEYAQPLSLTLDRLVALEYSQKNVAGAQSATEQLLAVYDDLAARDPATYRAGLAQCYHNLGYFFDTTGNKAEGIRYTLEAVKMREELLESDFDSHAPALARGHNNLGNMYHQTGELAKAGTHLERAYGLRLQWVEGGAGRKLPEIAKSAEFLANLCRDRNDGEGEALWRERVVRHGQTAGLPPCDRGMAAHALAEALGRLGRTREAAAAAKLAAEEFREELSGCTAEADRARGAHAGCNLASALTLYGDWMNDGETLAQALEVARQTLTQTKPEEKAYEFVWGALMNNLGHAQFRQGEMQGRSEGVREGIASLKTGMEHHLKFGNKPAAEETRQLMARAQETLSKMQAKAVPGGEPESMSGN